MSLWNDFWDFVDNTVHDVGDTLSDAWQAVKNNPIGTITSAVAMAYGIPPAWAGALGGAAGAASTGGDVVKAAITGGAMGYMGAAAGAAAGSAGAIAQAAAAGTAASVTGAILTGQDLVTAAKQGLILGSVTGGVVKLMTPAEAIQSVPTQSLADLTANSSDPLGELIKQQGWTDSDSARAAASKAFSKNAATTQTMLQESIPDYVLKAASKTANPGEYIVKELGWNSGSLTLGAANKAAGEYNSPAAQKARLAEEQKLAQQQAQQLADQQAQQQAQQLADQQAQQQAQHQQQLNSVQNLVDQSGGYLTAQQIIDQHLTAEDVAWYKNYMDQLHGVNQTPQQPAQPEQVQPTQPTQPEQVAGPVTPEQPTQTVEPQQPVQPTQTAEAGYTDVPGSHWLNQGNGTSIDTHGNIVESSTGKIISAGSQSTYYNDQGVPFHLQNGEFVYGPGQSVDVSNITQEQLNQITQENNPYTNTNQGTQTSQGPVEPTQETTDTPYRVDVGGSAGFAGNPGSVVNEYRTPNSDLATQEQIDNGTASWNASANAWEVPTEPVQPETPVTVAPPVVPPETPVQQTQPTVTEPVTQPVTQPVAPTVVSSSTRTTSDGSVYKDEQLSDGTSTSVLVSGPVVPSGQTSTGGTTNPNKPLTPPTQEVIPPGSSYVAPVETTPTTPPVETTPTTPPVDTTPIVPMIPPTGQPTVPTEDTTYGHYTLGKVVMPNIAKGLNPGYITNVPEFYHNTNSAQAKYYWGAHPFQAGSTFDPTLYNQVPNAPATPWGATHAQTAATPQQILQAMGQVYPLLNTVNGPVQPTI